METNGYDQKIKRLQEVTSEHQKMLNVQAEINRLQAEKYLHLHKVARNLITCSILQGVALLVWILTTILGG